MEMVNLVIDI